MSSPAISEGVPVRHLAAAAAPAATSSRFRLKRYFAIGSLACIVVAAVLLGLMFRSLSIDSLIRIKEAKNTELAQIVARATAPVFSAWMARANVLDNDSLRRDPQLRPLHDQVAGYIRGTEIAKIKVYDRNGRTVFSTEAKQIGEDKSANAGFNRALAGKIATELTHRDRFSAFDREIVSADLLSSYIPVPDATGSRVEYVYELYETVTESLQQVARTQAWVMSGVAAVLLVLYSALFALVARADRILRAQEQTIARDANLRLVRDELEAQVADRTAALRAANEELESFSYSVAHDLRAPLRAIGGYTRLLQDEYTARLDQGAHDLSAKIVRNVATLARLIDALLELSRVSRAEPRRDWVDLSTLAEDIVATLRAAEPGRQTDISIEPGLAAYADADLARIVLSNLIGNAWKYSMHTPCVRVQLGRSRVETGPQFEIRDHGVGIEAQYAHQLFKPFSRLHGADRFPGTGIGLVTISRIVARHGGSVHYRPQSGPGATFAFDFGPAVAAARA